MKRQFLWFVSHQLRLSLKARSYESIIVLYIIIIVIVVVVAKKKKKNELELDSCTKKWLELDEIGESLSVLAVTKKQLEEVPEYATVAYVACIDEMIKLMIDRRIKAAVLVLMEVKILYGPPESPSQTIWVELSKASSIVGDDQEVESQQSPEEGSPCPLLEPGTFDDIAEENPF